MHKLRNSYRNLFRVIFLSALILLIGIGCSKSDQGLNFYSPQEESQEIDDPTDLGGSDQTDTTQVTIKKIVTCEYGDQRFGSSKLSPYSKETETKLEDFARQFVSSGVVNYGVLAADTEALKTMCQIVQSMTSTDFSILPIPLQRAYGVNLVNLLSIQLATFNFVKTFGGQNSNLPFKRSLLNIDPKANPYADYYWLIAGNELNINDMVSKFINVQNDPRLRLLVNFARKGDFSEQLFLTSENLEQQTISAISSIMDNFDMVDFDNTIEDLETIYLSDTFQSAFPDSDETKLREFLATNINPENYDFDPQDLLKKKPDGSHVWAIEWTPSNKELNNGVF